MIVRTGAPASFEPSSSIPVRRFTFRVGHGRPEQLLDGPRLATLVKATSSLSVIDVEGIRIVLDGPIGGRPGKQLIVQAFEEDTGLKLEVRPRPAAAAEPESGTLPSDASKRLGTVLNDAVPNDSTPYQTPAKGPVPSSPPAAIRQPNGPTPEAIRIPAQESNAQPGNLKAIAISETVEGSARTTLLGVAGSQPLPLRAGEELPVQAVLARPERTVFSVRGTRVEADTGGFQNGKVYWAEVVSSAPHAVIRIQSEVDAAALQAIAASQPSTDAASTTHTPEVLLPADFPSGTNLLARVIARLPSGEFLIEVGGRQLAAPLRQGIQEGEELLLRIESGPQGAPQVRVVDRLRSLVQPPPARLALPDSLGLLSRQLKALLAQGEESPQLLRLAAKVESMIGKDAPPTAQRIAAVIEEGGLQYESRLARILLQNRPQSLVALLQNDLKALLLRAQSDILQPTDLIESRSRLAESIDRHLNLIENLQSANLATQSQSAPLQFEIPLLSAGQLSTVELFIQPDGEDSDSVEERPEKGFNILFLLELQGLGRTRVDAHLSGKSLSALISVERSSVLEMLQSLLPRLEEGLEQAGFPSARLGVRLLEEGQLEAEAASSLGPPQPAASVNPNLIDVVA